MQAPCASNYLVRELAPCVDCDEPAAFEVIFQPKGWRFTACADHVDDYRYDRKVPKAGDLLVIKALGG